MEFNKPDFNNGGTNLTAEKLQAFTESLKEQKYQSAVLDEELAKACFPRLWEKAEQLRKDLEERRRK